MSQISHSEFTDSLLTLLKADLFGIKDKKEAEARTILRMMKIFRILSFIESFIRVKSNDRFEEFLKLKALYIVKNYLKYQTNKDQKNKMLQILNKNKVLV